MATAKPILNTKYKGKDDSYPIVIRLINGKKQKLHPLGERISESFWENGRVSKKHPEAKRINSLIDIELSKAKTYFADCLMKGIPPDLDLVFSEVKSHSFTAYLHHRSNQHKESDQLEMYYKVKRYIKELDGCFSRQVYFSDITQDFLRVLDSYLKGQGNGSNTRYKKYEFLGKYYNNAITEKKATDPNPFKIYKKQMKKTPVKKEKLSIEQFKEIEELQLKDGPVRLARDLFLFSYYCKGIRFETCITMPKTAIANERLYFQTNKGKKHLSAQLHPKLKAIVARYLQNDTDTVFGRVSYKEVYSSEAMRRSILGSENTMINRSLKEVAALCGLPIALSMHHSRHTFAYHLKKHSNNIHVIKDSLGHSRTQVTENYLKDLDDEFLDDQLSGLYK